MNHQVDVLTASSDLRPPPFFVGDHLALDFVNSRSTPGGVWTDWLRDGRELVDWLERAGAIDPVVAGRFREDQSARRALDGVAGRARDLRDWLRGLVERHAGQALEADAAVEMGPLNDLLAEGDSYWRVAGEPAAGGVQERGLSLTRQRRWTSPDQLLQPLAEAIADLVCREDFRLVRVCEGKACVLVFLDRTKSHARRWCSMALCGNRAKAAAHRARSAQRRP